MTGETPEQRVVVVEGVVQRLSAELAQARVTVAELDTRLQLATADIVRLETERDAAIDAQGPSPEPGPS